MEVEVDLEEVKLHQAKILEQEKHRAKLHQPQAIPQHHTAD
jgi:hypothetical protein